MSSKMVQNLIENPCCFCIAFLITFGRLLARKIKLFGRYFGKKTCIYPKVRTLSIYCACQYLLRFGPLKKGTFLVKNLDFCSRSEKYKVFNQNNSQKAPFWEPKCHQQCDTKTAWIFDQVLDNFGAHFGSLFGTKMLQQIYKNKG